MPILERSRRNDEDGDDGDDPLESLFNRARAAVGLGPRELAVQSKGWWSRNPLAFLRKALNR